MGTLAIVSAERKQSLGWSLGSVNTHARGCDWSAERKPSGHTETAINHMNNDIPTPSADSSGETILRTDTIDHRNRTVTATYPSTPSADEKVETPTITVEYIESGTFVGGEEDVFNANIKTGDECVVMSKAAFVLLAADRKKEREQLGGQIVVLKAECFALKENLDDRRARVERLESELATAQKFAQQWREKWEHQNAVLTAWQSEVESLRSELQSAQATIAEAIQLIAKSEETGWCLYAEQAREKLEALSK